jgi:hypothetical protein
MLQLIRGLPQPFKGLMNLLGANEMPISFRCRVLLITPNITLGIFVIANLNRLQEDIQLTKLIESCL